MYDSIERLLRSRQCETIRKCMALQHNLFRWTNCMKPKSNTFRQSHALHHSKTHLSRQCMTAKHNTIYFDQPAQLFHENYLDDFLKKNETSWESRANVVQAQITTEMLIFSKRCPNSNHHGDAELEQTWSKFNLPRWCCAWLNVVQTPIHTEM